MQRPFDPVLVEVIKNEIAAVTEEMTLTVYRTGRSGMCKVGDFATAVCDSHGRIVGEGGSPYQMCVFIDTMSSVLTAYGGELRPGDIIIANDPYAGISHMPDITLIAPVFWRERLVAFAISYSHHTDIGGRFAGGISSVCSESFEEGVRIPPLKLYDQGSRNEAMLEAIVANVRTPEEWIGDVEAKVASCRRGAEQLNKLIDRYGLSQFEATCDYLVDYSENATRNAISRIPDGEYTEQSVFDEETEVTGGPVPLKVILRILGDSAVIDLSSAPPQVKASINSPLVTTKAMARAAMKAIVRPDAIANIGFARPIEVVVPPGTILNPRYPGAVGGRASLAMHVSNMVFRALAKAVPGQLGSVGEGADMLHFICHEDGRYQSFMDVFFGGWGGRPDRDGVDGASPMAMGGAYGAMPAEVLEREYPVVVEGFGYVPDTEGAGKYRGALSVYRQWHFRKPAQILIRTIQVRGSEGLAGGRPGGDSMNLVKRNGAQTELPPQAHVHLRVEAGDRIYHQVHGSGGYGNSCERDPRLVLDDCREGKISVHGARERYGVVIDPETFVVDVLATQALRSSP
ncbi:MAG: hydantoinase B/oxoprolinase family protein [Deltaproteobacteria bacterium]|nr:hydantoinase B/oxoprolinase family protein [Deltaproteobacteria bacterium]